MRVLYISSIRAKERILLSNINGLEFIEVKIRLREDFGFSLLKKIYSTFNIAKSFNPDLILSEGLGLSSLFTIFLKKRYNIPLFIRIKGQWKDSQEVFFYIPLKEKIAKLLNYLSSLWILKNADIALPISNSITDFINTNVKNPPKSYIVHITCEISDSNIMKKKIQNVNSNYILSVTNFDFWGKIEPLLNAVHAVYPIIEELGLEWIILGGGIYFEKCKSMLKMYKKHIKLLGYQNTYVYYNGPVLFMLYISGMDALPNVLLESFYHKIPVVINHDCPAAEFILDEYNGVLADFNNTKQIENVIKKMINDSSYRQTLGENAYNYLYKNFSTNVVSEQLMNAFQNGLQLWRSTNE